MELEEKLVPLRARHHSDDRTLRLDALPEDLFVDTDDLPVEKWPAHRTRRPILLPPTDELDKADQAAIIAWLIWQRDRSWCPTGRVLRERKSGTAAVSDPDAEPKKADRSRLNPG